MADLWKLDILESRDRKNGLDNGGQMWIKNASQKIGYQWETFIVQGWQDEAACSGLDPALFDVDGRKSEERDAQVAKAISVCSGCPVRQQCLEAASPNDLAFTVRGGQVPTGSSNEYTDSCTKCGTVSWQIMSKGRGRKPSRRCGECARIKSQVWRDRAKLDA